MSFTSLSAKARARKEYVLSEATASGIVEFEECEELKADRFERKGPGRKSRKIPEGVVISTMRGKDSAVQPCSPVILSSMRPDEIRLAQNLEAYPYAFEADSDCIAWACGMAAESPTARLLLKEAQSEGWTIGFDDLSQAGYAIDEDKRETPT